MGRRKNQRKAKMTRRSKRRGYRWIDRLIEAAAEAARRKLAPTPDEQLQDLFVEFGYAMGRASMPPREIGPAIETTTTTPALTVMTLVHKILDITERELLDDTQRRARRKDSA